MRIAVIDIGGTAIKSGLLDNGELSKLKEYDTDAKKGGSFVLDRVVEILTEYQPFDRIGISTAGQVDSKEGIIKYANSNIPGYTGTRIRERLEKEFGVITAVENDVNAAAIGEAHFGAGRKYQDFLCLTYGTGVGGAIILDGDVYRGTSFSAGEMGAIIIHPEDRDPQKDPFSGCYEKYASATALVNKAKKFNEELSNGKKIFEQINRPEVKIIVDDWIDEMIYGLTSLIHIFNPQAVILGGGVMKQPYILEQIRNKLYHNIMDSYCDVEIVQATLGNTAGLYGAGFLASKE